MKYIGLQTPLHRAWVVNFAMVLAFVLYLYYNTRDITDDTGNQFKKAMISFLIAIIAELGVPIVPFWLIFVVAYYLQSWV